MNARSLIVAEEAIVKMENAFACRVLLANFVKMVNCILDRDPILKIYIGVQTKFKLLESNFLF